MARHDKDILDRLAASLSLRGILFHPATLFVIATAVMIGAAIFLWERQQEHIIDVSEFRLTEDNIRLTPPPVWAEIDLKQLVLNECPDSPPSILDTKLVPRTAATIRKIGFVDRVRSIEKSKSGLEIDVVYRQPVGRVELSKITIPEWPATNSQPRVLLPVDRHGVVMPESLAENNRTPLITVLYPAQFSQLTTWADWPDERIKDAASIAALFATTAERFGVKRVVTFRKPDDAANAQVPFELWSGTGTRILWGNAPGKESENESSAEAKLVAITALITQYGALDALTQGKIDIRSGEPIAVGNSKTAAVPELIFAELK